MHSNPYPPPGALSPSAKRVAVIGGGPAGLMAAEGLAARGMQVDVYDAMPSVGRKFLMAGRGGLNLTHSEAAAPFLARYGERAAQIAPWLRALDADGLREWAAQLGIETFVGSSGRVFPAEMKAAPLLRAWLARLRGSGVRFHMRHRWLGWPPDRAPGAADLRFDTPDGLRACAADAVVLALGGGSWAKLGSDGAWLPGLAAHGIATAPLRAANCGFEVAWSEHFRQRYAGQPVKSVTLRCVGEAGPGPARKGEFVVTAHGIEGSLVYALSPMLRDAIARDGHATLVLDLLPGREEADLARRLAKPRGSRSLSEHLRREAGVTGVRAALLYEVLDKAALADPACIARTLKRFPFRLQRTRPIAEAISSAGGIRMEALDPQLMLRALPGVFAAGEMLDWEAPTGGYLLTACFASGRHAAHGVIDWLAQRSA